jgi:AraC family transcriptional regulator
MNINPRIETCSRKLLIGKRLRMTLAENKTAELWKSFMPRRKEILNVANSELISMHIYDKSLNIYEFTLNTEFEKWALAEVTDFDFVPDGMETYILPEGLYIVFTYIGLPQDYGKTYMYIINEWLPNSEYEIENREHFEILGDKYRNNQPDSEEEIWIPIKIKNS